LHDSSLALTPLPGRGPLLDFAASCAMVCFPFAKSVPRGANGVDLSKQTIFLENTGEWVVEPTDDGPQRVFHGPKGMLGLGTQGDPAQVYKDKTGLIISSRESLRTVHDAVFKVTAFDSKPAIARCTKPHTFKDAMLPNGNPNPKPTVVDVPGTWEAMTYAEVKTQARAFGMALRKVHGLGQKEKISLWASNCSEWLLSALACVAYNWTVVSVYDTLGPNAASYIVADSGSQVIICEDKTFKLVPKLLDDEVYTSNPAKDLKTVVYLGKGDADTKAKIEAKGLKVLCYADMVSTFKEQAATAPEDTPPTPEDIYTIMYTSGTTGMPKGVMMQHVNVVSTVSVAICLSLSLAITPHEVWLSYLPLAHVFEQLNCLGMLTVGAVINMASNGAKGLLSDLSVIKPTLFAGVPKVYENIRDAVMRKMTGRKKKLFDMAMAAKIKDIETGCGYCPLWDTLVFNKTKAALGGRVRACVTGGAPISKDTLQFVICALAPVAQGYGTTETSSACTLAMTFDMNVGHVGAPLGTAAVRLVDVPDMNYFSGEASAYEGKAKAIFDAGKNKSGGEVWVGGPGVSIGYYDPSVNGLKSGIPSNGMAKKTEEDFFMEDGWSWFKTGDIGSWNKEGTLRIVDRRKNMFKTSLGEYVPVEEVEKTYQDSCHFVDFVFLPKETKVSYVAVCCVVSESIGSVMRWAKENGIAGDDCTVCASKEFQKLLFSEFEDAAKKKKLQRFMWIQKPENIYVEYQAPGYQEEWVQGVMCANGHVEQLLTATFKSRRAQLDQYFAPRFPKMYPDRPADHILP